jgi:hypothetical protein
MATYTDGTSAAANGRPDLAYLAGRWAADYPEKYIALDAFPLVEVSAAGSLSIDGRGNYVDVDPDGKSTIRGMGADPPQADPATRVTYNYEPQDRGLVVPWDESDENVRRRRAAGVDPEMVAARQSTNLCLQAVDTMASNALTASTSPFTATADTDISSAKWSTASNPVRSVIHDAITAYDNTLDSMVISFKAWNYLLGNTDITSTFTGALPNATLSNERARAHMAEFGITSVFVGETNIWGATVILYNRGGGNVLMGDYSGVVMPFVRADDSDERGLTVRTWDAPHGQTHYAYTFLCSDVVIDIEGGCRIVNSF